MVPAPEIYRLWAAITAISGVLERKVWTTGSAGDIYPNLFTFLVGPPGSGKDNAIRPIRELWGKVQGLNISPDNVTKASLIDALAKSLRTVINGSTTAYSFSAMCVPCPELGVFFTHHDLEFLSVINHIYMSPPSYREERRTSGAIEINKPHLVILGGTQPDFLNSLLPEEAWGMGFTSRVIMIYANETFKGDLFATVARRASNLAVGLNDIFKYKGEFSWTRPAVDEINAWNNAGCPPTPTHSKLLHYNRRRALHTIKLAMISSAASSPELIVTVDDFERAKDWLIAAEIHMPDIFRAMGQRSDTQILTDLHFHLYRKWSSVTLDLRKPIVTQDVYKFLESRVPSEKIKGLMDVAEKAGYMRRGQYPDEWIPNTIGSIGSA
jgi:hypothetical protein